ncbi:MAG: HEAT repeat domain-containing protein [Planctomycetota bacterium]|jgi:HEAT repeat protein
MTSDQKADVAFVMAVAAALGMSLLAGLALAPSPLPPEPPPPVPQRPDVPSGFDPFQVDRAALEALRGGLGKQEKKRLADLGMKIETKLTAEPPAPLEAEEAIRSLAERGESGAVLAVDFLADERPVIRRAGARLAGHLESPLLVPALAPLLEDLQWEVQADAAWALGKIGDRSAVIDLLKWRAEKINKPRHTVVYLRVAEALLRLGNTSCVDYLIDGVIGHPTPVGSPVFQGSLATAALKEQSGRSFGFDRESYKEANEAAASRWAIWWEEWRPHFAPGKPSPDRTSPTRLAAGMQREIKALKGERYYLQHFGRLLLARAGSLAVDFLLPELYAGDPGDPMDPASHLRLNAAETLKLMVEMGLHPAPDKALLAAHMNLALGQDRSAPVRAACARALALLGDRRSVAPLLERLSQDGDLSVRIESARALGELAFTSAAGDLETFTRSAPSTLNPVLRAEAEAARLRCLGLSPLKPFVETLTTAVTEQDRGLCEEILTRLGELTGRRTKVPPWGTAADALVASWNRLEQFDASTVDLVEAYLSEGGGPALKKICERLRSLLGPDVPPPPSIPRAAVGHFLEFRDYWKVVAKIRAALDADELDTPTLLASVKKLEKVTRKSCALHPRLQQMERTRELEKWTAWGEKNAPGCPPRVK